MEYVQGSISFSQKKESVITLGKFDGVHMGHQKLIRAMEEAKEGLESIVFTFDVPPLPGRSLGAPLKEEEKHGQLTTNSERAWLLEELGVDKLIECPFLPRISGMEAETFLREILVGQLHVRKIFVGEDFRFGYKRCGDVELLKAGEEKYGYTVTVVDKACFGPDKVSSSTIRRLLRTGSLREANAMLGRPMFYTGPIVAGNQIGRTLGFPTANLPVPEEKALLPSGVYGVTFYTEGERYYGAANIGRKPTVQQRAESAIGIETHLFDCSRDLYGKNVKINFHFFVRPERRFDSLESLKEEIHKNERQIREYFEKNPEF